MSVGYRDKHENVISGLFIEKRFIVNNVVSEVSSDKEITGFKDVINHGQKAR